MNIHNFTIGWTDLNFEAQEEIIEQVRLSIKENSELMTDLKAEVLEEMKELGLTDLEGNLELKIDELAEENARKSFTGNGTIYL